MARIGDACLERAVVGQHDQPLAVRIESAGRVDIRHVHQVGERGAEFPRLDDRLVGHRNRFGYAAVDRQPGGDLADTWATIVRYDRQGGPTEAHDFGLHHWPSEPVFVPRSADAAEHDGFLLTVVYDGTTDGSYLAVLDAANVAGEPLATCRLPHRIPMGFHGNFVPGLA